jgi:hypothetical protein
METSAAVADGPVAHPHRRGWRSFALHYLEMVVVMFVGMGVFYGLVALAFSAAGSSTTAQPGWFRVLLMGVVMTVPMVAWMTWRGHAVGRSVEMAAAMMLPTLVAAWLALAGVLGVMSALGVQHAAMLPAMLLVMLWRYREYAH